MSDRATNNLRTWSAVCKTDPSATKKVSFGRSFTAIDPTYQSLKATELWGPEGGSWGVENVRYETVRLPDESMIATCEIDLRHPDGIVRGIKSAEDLCVKDRKGNWRHDCEAFKKARTNARSKALAQLGFSADVFLGLFDDVGYVRHREQEERQARQQPRQEQRQEQAKPESAPKASREVEEILGQIRSIVRGFGPELRGEAVARVEVAKPKGAEALREVHVWALQQAAAAKGGAA